MTDPTADTRSAITKHAADRAEPRFVVDEYEWSGPRKKKWMVLDLHSPVEGYEDVYESRTFDDETEAYRHAEELNMLHDSDYEVSV